MQALGRLLLLAGLALAALGLLLIAGGRVGLGRLPGDLVVRGRHVTLFVPLATSLLLSALLTLVLWLLRR